MKFIKTHNGLCFENIPELGYKKPNPNDFCSFGERKESEEIDNA